MKRLGRFLAYMERGRKYVGIANSALILATNKTAPSTWRLTRTLKRF